MKERGSYKDKNNAFQNSIRSFSKKMKDFLANRIKKKCFEVMKTPCDHYFHKRCLERWFQNKVECPYCRSELEVYGKLGKSLSF